LVIAGADNPNNENAVNENTDELFESKEEAIKFLLEEEEDSDMRMEPKKKTNTKF